MQLFAKAGGFCARTSWQAVTADGRALSERKSRHDTAASANPPEKGLPHYAAGAQIPHYAAGAQIPRTGGDDAGVGTSAPAG
jgi:hypothetical protein